MKFDPRTEAEVENEQEKNLIALAAAACAYLQAVYNETDSERVADAFEEIWGDAVKLVHPAEFYRQVSKASEMLRLK